MLPEKDHGDYEYAETRINDSGVTLLLFWASDRTLVKITTVSCLFRMCGTIIFLINLDVKQVLSIKYKTENLLGQNETNIYD